VQQSVTPKPVRNLPDFEHPPAIETYMGVHFDRLESWTLPHFGLFWNRIREEYPKAEVRPPIAAKEWMSFEYGTTEPPGELRIPVRYWFISHDNMRLIQVQNNLFLHNWRRGGNSEAYSHYGDLRPKFEQDWIRFTDFVRDEKIGMPKVSMCEVTYINHLERGMGWQTMADLPDVSPCWSGMTAEGYLPSPNAVAIRAFYRMKDPDGTLEIALQSAVRQPDAKEIIQLTLTGRCKPGSSDDKDLISGLNAAHEWVVRGFTDFTSPKLHNVWGRTL